MVAMVRAVRASIAVGSPAATTRGFGETEFRQVGEMMLEVLRGLSQSGEAGNAASEQAVLDQVTALTGRFPLYAGPA